MVFQQLIQSIVKVLERMIADALDGKIDLIVTKSVQ